MKKYVNHLEEFAAQIKKDWQAKGRVNAIRALLAGVFITVALFLGTINSNVFYVWGIK